MALHATTRSLSNQQFAKRVEFTRQFKLQRSKLTNAVELSELFIEFTIVSKMIPNS
jgi:hypothetical protein